MAIMIVHGAMVFDAVEHRQFGEGFLLKSIWPYVPYHGTNITDFTNADIF